MARLYFNCGVVNLVNYGFNTPNPLTVDRSANVDINALFPNLVPPIATALILTAEFGYLNPAALTAPQACSLRLMPYPHNLTSFLDRAKGTFRAGPIPNTGVSIPNDDISIAMDVTVPVCNGNRIFFYALQSTDNQPNKILIIDLWGYEITQRQEIGVIDIAGNADGSNPVVRGNTLYVYGWAADTATGAPVQNVTVLIDGISVGAATLGAARPDVAQVYGRSDFTNSGWTFQMSTSGLSVGPHPVTATVTGQSGTGALTARTVTIQ